MKYAFKHITLQAKSLYTLIDTWIETRLVITEDNAYIEGDGYAHDILAAFSALVLDWEARIFLPRPDFQIGTYGLILLEDGLYACHDQHKWKLEDMAVRVEVWECPED